jgi:hypothetical protein
MNTHFAHKYTMFGRMCYLGMDLLLISFLYCSKTSVGFHFKWYTLYRCEHYWCYSTSHQKQCKITYALHHAQYYNEWLSHLSLCKWRKVLSSSGSSLPRELCLCRVAYGLPRLLKPSSSLAPLSLTRLLQKKHIGII